MFDEDEKDMLAELRAVGIDVTSVWLIKQDYTAFKQAVPVLVKHLAMEHHPKIIGGIACLIGP